MLAWLWLVIAFVLLFLEFYLPGGIMAMISVVFFLLALVYGYQIYGIAGGVLFFLISLFGGGAVIWFALTSIRKSRNTFILQSDQEGYEGSEKKPEYIGKEGVAVTDLSPAGFILIDEKRIQVISQDGYVEKGKNVAVIESRGGYLIVKTIK
jgi:membrane-bound serine protease (ClpP class)